jgi:hypothetical protein
MSETEQERVAIFQPKRLFLRKWSKRRTLVFAIVASAMLWVLIIALVLSL